MKIKRKCSGLPQMCETNSIQAVSKQSFEELTRGFQEERRSPNVRRRLELIARGAQLFSQQFAYENYLKAKALAVVIRDRANAKGAR